MLLISRKSRKKNRDTSPRSLRAYPHTSLGGAPMEVTERDSNPANCVLLISWLFAGV